MKLIEMNWNPSERQLRQFGLIALVVLPLLGVCWGVKLAWLIGLIATGSAIALAGWYYPRSLKPLFVGLSLAGMPVGLVMGFLALALVYFIIFTPLAVVFRMFNRDALQRRLDRTAGSYWQPRPQAVGVASYFRQS
jgi:hypothetical protein